MQEIDNKKFFKKYAFFILILVIIFTILSYMTVLAHKSWTKNLSASIQKVLNEKENGRWQVGKNIDINKPLTVNCAAYEVLDTKTNSIMTAVIVRVVTFYGPVPAVYIYNQKEEQVEFAGYSSLHGRIQKQLMNNKSDKRREYWQDKIPDILK